MPGFILRQLLLSGFVCSACAHRAVQFSLKQEHLQRVTSYCCARYMPSQEKCGTADSRRHKHDCRLPSYDKWKGQSGASSVQDKMTCPKLVHHLDGNPCKFSAVLGEFYPALGTFLLNAAKDLCPCVSNAMANHAFSTSRFKRFEAKQVALVSSMAKDKCDTNKCGCKCCNQVKVQFGDHAVNQHCTDTFAEDKNICQIYIDFQAEQEEREMGHAHLSNLDPKLRVWTESIFLKKRAVQITGHFCVCLKMCQNLQKDLLSVSQTLQQLKAVTGDPADTWSWMQPYLSPTSSPTSEPTTVPTAFELTAKPSFAPTAVPTISPTSVPTKHPTFSAKACVVHSCNEIAGFIPNENVGYPFWTSHQVSLWLKSLGKEYTALSKIVLLSQHQLTGDMLQGLSRTLLKSMSFPPLEIHRLLQLTHDIKYNPFHRNCEDVWSNFTVNKKYRSDPCVYFGWSLWAQKHHLPPDEIGGIFADGISVAKQFCEHFEACVHRPGYLQFVLMDQFGIVVTPSPTYAPSILQTETPTKSPVGLPTAPPTVYPTPKATMKAHMLPQSLVRKIKRMIPTQAPTAPTVMPTATPTALPTSPTQRPTPATRQPSKRPTGFPTDHPTQQPTFEPTNWGWWKSSDIPKTKTPTLSPTPVPSMHPTVFQSSAPTITPSYVPTIIPTSRTPTTAPTARPTFVPTTEEVAKVVVHSKLKVNDRAMLVQVKCAIEFIKHHRYTALFNGVASMLNQMAHDPCKFKPRPGQFYPALHKFLHKASKKICLCIEISEQRIPLMEATCKESDCGCSCCQKAKLKYGDTAIKQDCQGEFTASIQQDVCTSYATLQYDYNDHVPFSGWAGRTFTGSKPLLTAQNLCVCMADCLKHPASLKGLLHSLEGMKDSTGFPIDLKWVKMAIPTPAPTHPTTAPTHNASEPTHAPTGSPSAIPTILPTTIPTAWPTHSATLCVKNGCYDSIIQEGLLVTCTSLTQTMHEPRFGGNPCVYYTTVLWDHQRGLPPMAGKPVFKRIDDARNLCGLFAKCMNVPSMLPILARERGVHLPTPAPTFKVDAEHVIDATLSIDGYQIVGQSGANPRTQLKFEQEIGHCGAKEGDNISVAVAGFYDLLKPKQGQLIQFARGIRPGKIVSFQVMKSPQIPAVISLGVLGLCPGDSRTLLISPYTTYSAEHLTRSQQWFMPWLHDISPDAWMVFRLTRPASTSRLTILKKMHSQEKQHVKMYSLAPTPRATMGNHLQMSWWSTHSRPPTHSPIDPTPHPSYNISSTKISTTKQHALQDAVLYFPTPSPTHQIITHTPTLSPTVAPTHWGWWSPVIAPTTPPSLPPTTRPTTSPTQLPTLIPTTVSPTTVPTTAPSNALVTVIPTPAPTCVPTPKATANPLFSGARLVHQQAMCINPQNNKPIHGNLLASRATLLQCSHLCRGSKWCSYFYFGTKENRGTGKCKRVNGKLFSSSTTECTKTKQNDQFDVYRLVTYPEMVHQNAVCKQTDGRSVSSKLLSPKVLTLIQCFYQCLGQIGCQHFYLTQSVNSSISTAAYQQSGTCSMITHADYVTSLCERHSAQQQGTSIFNIIEQGGTST